MSKRQNSKNKRRGNDVWRAVILGALLLAALLITASISYTQDMAKKPVLKDLVTDEDTLALYDFYIAFEPELAERPFIGSPEVPITVLAYMDMREPTAQVLISNVFPQLYAEYIETGVVRFYYKQRVTLQDYQKRTDAYWLAVLFHCLAREQPENYLDVYKQMPASRQEALKSIAAPADLEICLDAEHDWLLRDVSETEHFGLAGVTPRLYVGIDGKENIVLNGVPSYERLKQVLTRQQAAIGD